MNITYYNIKIIPNINCVTAKYVALDLFIK